MRNEEALRLWNELNRLMCERYGWPFVELKPPEKKCCEYEKYLTMAKDGAVATLCFKHFDLIQKACQIPESIEETVRKIWMGCSQDEGVKRICELLARSARGA